MHIHISAGDDKKYGLYSRCLNIHIDKINLKFYSRFVAKSCVICAGIVINSHQRKMSRNQEKKEKERVKENNNKN